MTGTRSVLGVLSLIGIAACTTTATVGYPAEYVSMRSPSHVWIKTADKNEVELFNPQIKGDSGDTLVGFAGKTGAYLEIPVSSVQTMKAKEAATGRTMIVVGATAIGSALLLTAVMGNGGTGGANVCFPPGGLNQGVPVPCPKPASASSEQ
ncbi:MAG TPA: hypothetical protein VLT79_09645 [Gemmatimonadales bacterium]|nr:hypothetical protein [Gemmatimonadales bacterium]